MYLADISVKNFRNIEELQLRLSPGLNVIVGENNVGKTNLLDAIRAGLGASSVTGEPIRVTKDDLRIDQFGNRTGNPIQVDFVFVDLTESERAQCLEILNYDPSSPDKSTASIHYEWSWDEKTQRWTMRRWAGDRPDAEATVPDEILQAMALKM